MDSSLGYVSSLHKMSGKSGLSHMHNTAAGFLHRLVHNSIKSFLLLKREVEQPGAADRDRK